MSHQTQEAPPAAISYLKSEGPVFMLDRTEATRVISQLWGLDPDDREQWWIGGFGDGLADSIETLSRVVFSPRRGLVSGPALEILVLPVMPDSPAHPVMVGIVDGSGPIVCRGVEDLVETLPDPFGHGVDHVLDALEALLAIASSLVSEAVWSGDGDRRNGHISGFEPHLGQEARVLGL